MEAMNGELDLSPDNILWNSYFDIKANCIEVVMPASKLFWYASTANKMEYWVKTVRAQVLISPCSQIRGYFHDVAAVALKTSGEPNGPIAGVLSAICADDMNWYVLSASNYTGKIVKICADLISSWIRRSDDRTNDDRKFFWASN